MRVRVIALCCAMLPFLACSCNASPTATYEPIFPTPVTTATTISSPAVKTSTPTPNPFEPHVTYSPTQPDPTPRPSHTPTPCGTCEPLHPLLYGSVTVLSWDDADNDGEWQMTGESVQEWGVPATVTLLYDGDLPLSVWNVTGVQIPTGWRGIAVYTTLLPGRYNVSITDYDEVRCMVPYHDNDIWAMVQAAGQTVVRARFWRKPGCYDYGTPTVTPTPQPTNTPIIVPCPDYYHACLPVCGANTEPDIWKSCGPGLSCCMPIPTRTAIPSITPGS